jgi:PPE-repeat protein
MLLYEMFAIGIAVVLVVAAIGGLAARVMMGPEETALARLARAAPAQRRLVASAAQQERDARAAAAQRRLVAAAAQQDDWIRRCLKRQYEDALAAPLSPRLATLITQLETQDVSA